MSFYNDKKKAYQLIDELFINNENVEVITYKVQTIFGFGSKIVNERIQLLEKIRERTKK